MAYTPREIKDRVAVGDDIFLVEDLGNNRIRLTPAPTHISEPGTPVNKALLQPIEDELGALSPKVDSLATGKVDKVPGKGLSTNDFTNALKNKLDGIEAGAQVNRPISSQAQAEAGTDNTTVMTPLRVKEAINKTIVTGVYTGTGTQYREINIGFQPKVVFVIRLNLASSFIVIGGTSDGLFLSSYGGVQKSENLKMTANGFIVGLGGEPVGNANGSSYFWIAFR